MEEADKARVTETPAFMIARCDPASSKIRVAAALKGAKPFATPRRSSTGCSKRSQGPKLSRPTAL